MTSSEHVTQLLRVDRHRERDQLSGVRVPPTGRPLRRLAGPVV